MIYEIFRWIGIISGYPFKWLFFKEKIYYENERASLRVKGGALVISNHFGPWDYILSMFLFFPRKLYVVASEHAFRNALFRFGMKFCGGIEANRITKSMSFIKNSIREIQKKHLVQIYPEGHNTEDGNLQPFFPSYILIAHKANAPIVPVIFDGNYGVFQRVHLIVGEPIDLTDYHTAAKVSKDDITRLNGVVYEKCLALREELGCRVEADRMRGKGE